MLQTRWSVKKRVDIGGPSRTKVELTWLAESRIVLLRRDLTPALQVLARAVLKSNGHRFQSAALFCYERSSGKTGQRTYSSLCS
jgi:hypothetical protein